MKKINIYTASNCPHCRELKQYLNRHGHTFVEWRIDQNRRAQKKLTSLGFRSVPQLEIDGRFIKKLTYDNIKKILI